MNSSRREAPRVRPADREHAWVQDAVHVTLPEVFGGSHSVYLTRDELQQVVQQAYDQLGLLAQPWTAEPPGCNGAAHCAATRHHAGCLSSAAVPA